MKPIYAINYFKRVFVYILRVDNPTGVFKYDYAIKLSCNVGNILFFCVRSLHDKSLRVILKLER